MSAPLLTLIANPAAETHTTSDRLEILHALIAAPTFDPVLREDVIRVASDHPVYGWCCPVPGCERSRATWADFCCQHSAEWSAVQRDGDSIADFLRRAQPLKSKGTRNFGPCLICPHALAYSRDGLCYWHTHKLGKWRSNRRRKGQQASLDEWAVWQLPLPDFGQCRVMACPHPGAHWLGLCSHHFYRYAREGKPGGAETVTDASVGRPTTSRSSIQTKLPSGAGACRAMRSAGRTAS